jgi:hypothetical protein
MSIQPETLMNAPTISTLNAGDNTYGSGANGISILQDVLTTPNGITLNSVGISYDSGTTITSTSWDDISTRVAALSAIAPNGLNASLLVVNNTISIQNADTAPTRVINTSAEDGTGGTHFGVAWVGNTLPFVMETLDATPLQVKDTQLQLTASTTGGSTNPILTLNNTNATGSVAMEVYKNKPTAGSTSDTLFQQSVYGKNSGNAKREYTRTTHTIRDATAGAEDGSIEMGCFVNGSFNNFLQLNGNQNEVNCLKVLDMGGNDIRTTTGDLTISTASSTGGGDIAITGKSGSIMTLSATQINLNSTGGNNVNLTSTGDINLSAVNNLIFTGANLQSSTSSGNSGQHLVITLNGVQFKIKLENS